MDPNDPTRNPRKLKFTPVARPNRRPRPPPPTNTEVADKQGEDTEAVRARLRRMNVARREPKVEKKSQVAFGPGDSSSTLLPTYGASKGANSANERDALTSSSTAVKDQSDMIYATEDTPNASTSKSKKEYKEPWDYNSSYYPTTLPLRKPYSGDPEILNQEEFGEAARGVKYDENAVNSAAELGLLEKSEEKRLIFFQFPPLPMVKQTVSKKGKEKVGTSAVSGASTEECTLEELPQGYMGKMLVYKSGAVKLKLGEVLFEVYPGIDTKFTQDVVAINTKEKHCSNLGEIDKMATVIPDLGTIGLKKDSS